MIQLARESRGYTQTELAELINIPQGNLSRMERDELGVKDEHLKNICKVLNYPESFFYQKAQICPTDTHYRKAIVLDQKIKQKAEAIMNIYKFNIEEMLKSLDLSIKNIPIFSEQYDSPEKIAQYLRSYWKLSKGPIDNLSKIIEENGIITIQMDFETDKIEGRTIVSETGHPIIFINKNSSGDRQRLTLAHELGHVILHINTMPTFARDEEVEAFRFASEFLMPISECQYDLTGKLNLEKLADLKRIWKVSMQSIITRIQKTDIANKNHCRYLWSQIVYKGWKKKEPIEIPKENPTLLNRMINMFMNELNYSKEDISNMFCINLPELEERYFTQKNKLRVA